MEYIELFLEIIENVHLPKSKGREMALLFLFLQK
jgi:hypothetical protein